MYRIIGMKKTIASVLAAAMLFTGNATVLYAAEPANDLIIDEVMEAQTVADTAEESSTVMPETEEGSEDFGSVSEAIAADEEGEEGSNKYDIEINQGFSLHVKKDQKTSDAATYMSNFVASKKTMVMVPIDAADENAAKEVTKNWELYYKEVTGDSESDKKLSWKGDEFSYQAYYDENSNTVSGKMMAYVAMKTGPSKGKYNFYIEDNGTKVAEFKNVDFYETKPLNILAVKVNAYYSKSANVNPNGGGGCPEDLVGKSVSCDDKWNGVIDQIKSYLLDVYPVADISIDEGQTMECGTAEYDMCSDDGQRKLWEEACKLQSKDKNTGKDKYDLILAFVMYRQDANGSGQGYTFGKPVNIITLTDPDMLPTVAHEIAHCYDVGDEYDGGSYNYRVNNVPLGYTSTGRDIQTGEAVSDSTKYTFDNVKEYNNDQSSYYWLSSKQYKDKMNGAKVMDDKTEINENGSGSVIYPSLHPWILSKDQFVHFATNGDTAYPTLSYMGSGYSGNEFYYFTTSVIWDHLFNKFLVKTKKQENTEEQNESIAADQAGEEDEDIDIYYDDDYREGESRMIEVSGKILYTSRDPKATVSGCSVEPMFSYDGDLSYIEYMDDDEKDIPLSERFVFAAIGADGKVIKSPVDGEESIVEFYGGNFNSAMPAPKPGAGAVDRRFQDFCAFHFDAEYPEGTKMFVVVKKADYSADKAYTKDNVLWSRIAPDRIIDGGLKKYTQDKKTKYINIDWEAAAYDEEDKATTKDLYVKIYYAPQGDDGDTYFVKDGDYEKDFGADTAGYAHFEFDPTKYTKNITDKAYVWVMVSDGVNGLDLFSDYDTPISHDYVLSLSLDQKSLDLKAGSSYQLKANASPENAKDKSVTWLSSDTGVASVSDNGIVTAVSSGTATVTAVANGAEPGNTVSASCIVKVTSSQVDPDDEKDKPTGEDTFWFAGFDAVGFDYTGSAITPDFRLYYGDTLLVKGTDYTVAYKNNKAVKEVEGGGKICNLSELTDKKSPYVLVKLKGNYDGTLVRTFTIHKKDLADADITVINTSSVAGNKPVKLKPVLNYNGKAVSNKEYTFEGEGWKADGYTEAGIYDVVAKAAANGSFTGTKNFKIAIKEASAEALDLAKLKPVTTASKESLVYDKKAKTPVYVLNKGTVSANLVQDVDYTVVYENNINVGKATVHFIAKEDSTKCYGSKSVNFKITKPSAIVLDNSKVVMKLLDESGKVMDTASVSFAKGGATPKVQITYTVGDEIRVLKEGEDYKLSYKSNKAVNKKATATAAFKGAYKGKASVEFDIKPQDLSKLQLLVDDIELDTSKAKDFEYQKTKWTLTDLDGKVLAMGKDYETIKTGVAESHGTSFIADGNNPKAGSMVTLTIKAKEGGSYTGKISASYRVIEKGKSIKKAKVTLKKQCSFKGGMPVTIKADDIEVKLTKNGEALKPGTDYEIVSYDGNLWAGKKAKLTIRGMGDYGCLKTVNFVIDPLKWLH